MHSLTRAIVQLAQFLRRNRAIVRGKIIYVHAFERLKRMGLRAMRLTLSNHVEGAVFLGSEPKRVCPIVQEELSKLLRIL